MKLYGMLKYMALFLAVTVFVMCYSMLTVVGDTPAHIYGGDVITTAGRIVTLPLSIEDNPGVAAFVLELSYNKDVLTFVDAVASSDADFDTDQWLFEINGDCFVWSNDTEEDNGDRVPVNIEKSGVMFDLVFEVAADALPGIIYPVKIQLKDSDPANMSDCNGAPVDVSFTPGTIYIEDTSGQRTVTNVTLESPADKREYWTGENFDITGAQLKVEYSDSTFDYITVTEQMLEAIPDTDTVGIKTVQVKYQNWEYVNDLTFDIEVKDPAIKNVTLHTPADKLTYMVGETFDVTGAQLKVEWTNGDTTYVDVTEDMLASIPDTNTAGTKTVQVVYQGWENTNDLTFDIEVKAADVTVKNVTLESPADKLSYTAGEKFEIDGAKLKIEWSDGSVTYVDVTEDMLEAIPDMDTAGTKTVQIIYQGWENTNDLTFDIVVVVPDSGNKIVSVEMNPAPSQKIFNVGDKFSSVGGKIKVTYENGEVVYIDITEDMCSGYDMSIPGEYEVTVSYEGFEFSYVIRVDAVENPSSGDFNLLLPFMGLILSAVVYVAVYMKKKRS